MGAELPASLAAYVPTGHRLWFAPGRDVEADKPKEKRNYNAQGGMNRRDWIICACGNALRLEQAVVDGVLQSSPPTNEEWLEAVNQCRLSVHGPKSPCLPVTWDGVEQPLREAPPAASQEPEKAAKTGKRQLTGVV